MHCCKLEGALRAVSQMVKEEVGRRGGDTEEEDLLVGYGDDVRDGQAGSESGYSRDGTFMDV